jgi:hypothetical protein
MTLRLFAMSFSPHSERARWALDHHQVPYTLCQHVPPLGGLPLRMHARQWLGKVSVPLAVDGSTVLRDSLAIAAHAERVGVGSPLFPDAAVVENWNAKSDRGLGAGRPRASSPASTTPAKPPAKSPGAARQSPGDPPCGPLDVPGSIYPTYFVRRAPRVTALGDEGGEVRACVPPPRPARAKGARP